MARVKNRVVAIDLNGKEYEFESKTEFYMKTFGYMPSGLMIKTLNSGGQWGGFRFKLDKPEETSELKEITEIASETMALVHIEEEEKFIIDTQDKFVDLGLGCEAYCEKYGITKETFYELHYNAVRPVTAIKHFYETMVGIRLNYATMLKSADEKVNAIYHDIEFNGAEDDSDRINKFNKLESALLERRLAKMGIEFHQFYKFFKQHIIKLPKEEK